MQAGKQNNERRCALHSTLDQRMRHVMYFTCAVTSPAVAVVAALGVAGRAAHRVPAPPPAPLLAYQNMPTAAAVVVRANARWSACTVAEFSKKFFHIGLKARI